MTGRASDLAARVADVKNPLCLDLIAGIALKQGKVEVTLAPEPLAAALGLLPEDLAPGLTRFTAPFQRKRRGIETRIVSGQRAPDPDATLLRLLAKAHRWCREMRQGTGLTEIARREGHSESYIRTRAPLAFLSPKIQSAIIAGTQPVDLTLERFVRQGIPLDWREQEAAFGFD